ncbi:MAG: sulfite exporter TauE/SafE family protein [Telluria sp.]
MTALLLGLVVGIILALTGAGGGILAVPLLVFGAGIGMAAAAPIGLMAVGMAAALGALLGLKDGIVRYRAALLIAAAGMLLSPFGLLLARTIDNHWLSLLFAAVLLYVGVRAIVGQRSQPVARGAGYPCARDAATGRFVWTAPCARALALSGALAGLLSGLLGVGGGFVMVPALNRYTDLAMQSVVATSLAVIALVSAAGVIASALAGQVAWPVALPFCGGALGGMLGGRMLAGRLGGSHLQAGFGAVACLVALALALKNL